MELDYSSEKVRKQCTMIKDAKKLFGGEMILATSLLARINALQSADVINDIVVQPQFHFHKLKNKNGKDWSGYFAIDVRTRRDPWRIILQPLDENKKPYNPCNIDEIAGIVRIVEIAEVSKHYE